MSKKTKPEYPAYSEGDKVVSLRNRYWWPFAPGQKPESSLLVSTGTAGTITRTNVLGLNSYEVRFEGTFTPLTVYATTIAPAPTDNTQPAQAQS